jgi:translation initiation factor IF-2
MSEERIHKIRQAMQEFNLGLDTIVEFLQRNGSPIERSPVAKLTEGELDLLRKEYSSSAKEKKEASEISIGHKHHEKIVIEGDSHKDRRRQADDELDDAPVARRNIQEIPGVPKRQAVAPVSTPEPEKPVVKPADEIIRAEGQIQGLKVVGKINLGSPPKTNNPAKEKPQIPEPKKEESVVPVKEEPKSVPETAVVEPVSQIPKEEPVQPIEDALIKAEAGQLKGLTVLGKIDLKSIESKPKNTDSGQDQEKRKRKRLKTGPVAVGGSTSSASRPSTPGEPFRQGGGSSQNRPGQNQQRQGSGQGSGQGRQGSGQAYSGKQAAGQVKATMQKGLGKALKKKHRDRGESRGIEQDAASKILKISEFVSVADLASLMDVSVNEVIATCMSLGMFVSINQRLDAEALTIIADEFGFETAFSSAEEEEVLIEEADNEEDLESRAPIVTIMGHVDHGKTSLLDYIRKTKVVASEAGGITQHIGAYNVRTESGRQVTFLDTPGHEAFTAMRARGAKVTDVVIIVVAADDSVMPQTKEAINHAQVAGVPIVIAINKIDKPGANPDKIKEALANLNILVEDWGGKYQCQEISAKKGIGISELLEKVVLESDILDLKANPNKQASGTVIEASLDKGRGYVATMLVQAGTLSVGDFVLCGAYYGKVKAMYDDTGARIEKAGPSTPVQVLGLNNAPQAGDKFNVMENEREAKELANKREQIQREQSIRTKKHITIDEIGRRIALGTFKELNLIIKGDVDGSVEALADSLQKLSTDEVAVRILHKAVGQISEADVMLASASDAIIIGFQVRPSAQARRQAETEEIQIKLYSIIYDAINDIKDAMEGLLAPKVEEVIVGTIEIREVFKISKVGNIAGCYVTDGFVKRNNGIRVIRDGIVIHTGMLETLKRFKDDVSEVRYGYECGLKVKNFNNIEVGDTIESFEERETKRTL